ncbi:hypothetical protein TNCV_2583161 [Trichonephila clavipes]|nr:hypothetical protein TNCV_2583161 [Trichonephila clavipes]
MNVCKCIVPSRHGGTLNIHQASSPLVRLVEEERWEAPDHPPGYSLSKLGWNRAKSYYHLYGAQGYSQRQSKSGGIRNNSNRINKLFARFWTQLQIQCMGMAEL